MYIMGFKARVNPMLVYFLTDVQWICLFCRWYNTYWPPDGQQSSQAFFNPCTFSSMGGTQTRDEVCGTMCALTIWAIPVTTEREATKDFA